MRDAYCIVAPFFKTLEKMDKTISSFISGVGSIGTGLVTNALAQKNAREQREWQEQMWLKQAKYNDPSAMAMRLRKAGLNPFIMTGAEPAGSAGTGALADTLPINNPFDSAVSTLRTFAEIDNINANTGKTETEIEKIIKDVEYIDVLVEKGLIDVETAKIYRDKLAPRLDAELKKIGAETEAAEASADESRASAESIRSLIDATKQKLIADANYAQSMTTWNNELLQFEKDLKSAQTQQAKATAANQWAQSKLTNITASLEEKYGDREYGARITSAEAAAKYAEELQAGAVKLQETSAALNENQALTNEARVEIERAAQDLKERTFALEENKFQLEAVKVATDTTIKIIEAATPW